ncbi:MAG: HD domain-containing protein [Dehalococcoidales bacterium]|nr:HD domain-containing protein [Dehalococcoidales bacterium]
MDEAEILKAAALFVKREMVGDASGHDWWHAYRVARTTRVIAQEEGANRFVCELAALLHDVADEKLNDTEEAGLRKVRASMGENGVDQAAAAHVLEIISTMSFRGGGRPGMRSPEGRAVQDADRLDAIGAIGIARVFAYCGARGLPIHDPNLPPRAHLTAEAYRHEKSSGINNFYEKLLKLKDLMNTRSGRRMAESPHLFMADFLRHFKAEWDGRDPSA